MYLHNLLFILRFNVPVNNFSVNMGQSNHFLGINQYSRDLMRLAQEHNTMTLVGIEPRTSSNALQLGHHVPNFKVYVYVCAIMHECIDFLRYLFESFSSVKISVQLFLE